MRLHLDTTPRKRPGAAPAASVPPCGVGRTGLRLPLIAFTGDGTTVSALARRAMR